MEFKLCNRGKTNAEYVSAELNKMYDKPNIIVGCHNVCAICKIKSFTIADGRLITADTDDELIEKIKKL